MKTSWKVGTAILVALGVFAFFARAELNEFLKPNTDSKNDITTVFPEKKEAILFKDEVAIDGILIPAYEAGAVLPDDLNLEKRLIEPITSYLKEHNEKALRITGFFVAQESEIKIGGYENLGFARAAELAKRLRNAGISTPRLLLSSKLSKDQNQSIIFELLNDNTSVP